MAKRYGPARAAAMAAWHAKVEEAEEAIQGLTEEQAKACLKALVESCPDEVLEAINDSSV